MVNDDGIATPVSLTTRAASSIGWLTAQTWAAKIGGFATMILLARLLTPADFGLVAVAMSVLPLVYLVADLGFGTFLVQADSLQPIMVRTAFWYSLGSGVVLCAGLILTAPFSRRCSGSRALPSSSSL
nr:hypothetical protein GCM10025699_06830 [Microbacterium flavescens]